MLFSASFPLVTVRPDPQLVEEGSDFRACFTLTTSPVGSDFVLRVQGTPGKLVCMPE